MQQCKHTHTASPTSPARIHGLLVMRKRKHFVCFKIIYLLPRKSLFYNVPLFKMSEHLNMHPISPNISKRFHRFDTTNVVLNKKGYSLNCLIWACT